MRESNTVIRRRADAELGRLRALLENSMTEHERLYVSDRVRDLLTDVRKGEAWLLAERLERIAVLLEQPALVRFVAYRPDEVLLREAAE